MADEAGAPAGQTPAPEQAPAQGAPSGEGASAGQPAQQGQPAAEGLPGAVDLPEPAVPWGKFREVQTSYTQYRRQVAQEQAKWEQQLKSVQQELEGLRPVKDDFAALEELLESNPEIAQQLYEQAKSRGNGTARGAQPQPAAVPQELQTVLKDVAELKQMLRGEREQQLMRQEVERDRQVGQQLDKSLAEMLSKVGMDEQWLPHVRGYVIERARAMPGLELEDVPYLFAEWRKPMQQLLSRQLGAWRSGKTQDSTLPPGTGSAAPVMLREKQGANDNQTAKILEEILRNKGWSET